MTKKILAIIPARGGSKALPRKSLLTLGDKSLIGHAVTGSLNSNHITRTLFTSDDQEMMEDAKKYGAEVLFKRPDKLATDTAASWDVVSHAVQFLEKNENWLPDFIVLLQPTTPFRTEKHIDAAIEKMLSEGKNSCLSVREVDYPPHWMFYINEIGKAQRLFQDGQEITRRQDAPVVWQPNGLIYVISHKTLTGKLILPQEDTYFYKMDWESSINIDNKWQYDLAKAIFNERNIEF